MVIHSVTSGHRPGRLTPAFGKPGVGLAQKRPDRRERLVTMRAGAPFQSSAQAPPRLLETRDWLLVALSFSTGIYEAVYFLSFGKMCRASPPSPQPPRS